jgi:hypothetical protein
VSKISIEGNASGTGTLTIAAPNTNSNFTLTLPTNSGTIITGTLPDGDLVGTTATQTLTNKSIVATQLTGTIAAARLPAGSVLQVVSTAKTDTFSVGGTTTFTEVTGLTVNITPTSSSNKILVLAQVSVGTSSYTAYLRLRRDSTDILLADAAGSRAITTVSMSSGDTDGSRRNQAIPITYLDSPNTTSSVSYKIMLGARRTLDTVYINRSGNDNNAYTFDPRTTSTITVMEIAA